MVKNSEYKIELSTKELKEKAIQILLSGKYDKVNGLGCAESVITPTKKDPWRKGRAFGSKNKKKKGNTTTLPNSECSVN